ncbi:GNAT family N-acetyltransferase [Bradyrhizobium sp. 83012]|uniref:GNAT family N-acetyltransferase n=1 Tax=Bradyrhizobium aeschynomenes TaxID=2734909 RepID=A0ABX2C9I7_9BRAD|nr:GNAT family N-acetyltransferase [Bradyrhizobium aeschynomenes]NPU14833.1 GNAT family N-acetyltransferase [Bradyrhizobium aeschynomenes]NPU64245.1 GNAT family N-acetyltransferase [Bradyrhizobium aeschynomenes]
MLTIAMENPSAADSDALMAELSATLARITGDSGRSSFDPDDVRGPQACFVVARDGEGQAVGCGALRPLAAGIAEVKRMYARPGTQGVGVAILRHLETTAAGFGYRAIWLETRLVNVRAVAFYDKHGYRRIPNYGKYAGRPEAVCFGKKL